MRYLPLLLLLLMALSSDCDPVDADLLLRAEECGIDPQPLPRCGTLGGLEARVLARARCKEAIEAADCEDLRAGVEACKGLCM